MASQHPAVRELDSLLHSLQSLKAPGVNKSKVDATSKLCLDLQNVSVEPLFVDSLIAAFRRSPVTHKLGVLYCIDSIMRQWVAAGAAHAGGVRKMTDNMPALMYELLPVTPDNQKEKLSKLFDIWVNTKTFPAQMLADFKQKLHAGPQPAAAVSSAPVSAAPAHLLAAFGAQPPPLPPQQVAQIPQPPPATSGLDASILAALSGLIQPPPQHAQVNAPQAAMNFNHPHQPAVTYPPQAQAPAFPQYASIPATGQSPYNAAAIAQTQIPSNPNPLAALMTNSQDPSSLASQLHVLQSLSQQLGPDGLRTLVAALGIPQQGGPPPAAPVQPVAPIQQQSPQQYGANSSYPPQNGNSYGRDDQGYNQRARSRSPENKRRRFSPPNRRESPTYGTYDPHAASSDSGGRGHDDRGRRGRKGYRNEFRQRTPPPATREYHEDSPMQRNQQPKPIGYDPKLPNGKVKVLSRTLFVGGVNDQELKTFFGRFGAVQSCIVNHDKRHAFLKLISHQDAIATKTSVEALPDSEYRSMFERVGWAVGFGPTPCADYNVGVSIIPIDLLTDADKKWLLTAEFGGTGGKPVATGMVVEEPDIEIGAGPSSKAIHRRGGGGGGGGGAGRGGNFGGRRGGNYDNASRYRKPDRPEPPLHPEPNTIGPPPPVPTFGAPIPGFSMNFR